MTAALTTSAALIGQLAETWTSIETLAGGFTMSDWDAPTACPGWTVRDQLAHLIGTESSLAGLPAPSEPVPSDAAHVRNDIGRVNEQWVTWLRRLPPEEIVATFRRITTQRLESLRSLSEAEWDEPSWTPAGPGDYRRFMQIRVFDSWVHEQDIRRAVGQPGHDEGPAAEAAIDEVERALGYVVGKQAGAPNGTRLTIELTGPVRRVIHVAVDGRAKVVETFDGTPTVVLRMTSTTFAALACGRIKPESAAIVVEGDQSVGQQITTNLPFTI